MSYWVAEISGSFQENLFPFIKAITFTNKTDFILIQDNSTSIWTRIQWPVDFIGVFFLFIFQVCFYHYFNQIFEFGFGFPPRLFGFRRGETTYSVNWIPLGGFVKITGEDGGSSPDPSSFVNKGFWARLSVLLAGVAMNFILAWVLLFLGFAPLPQQIVAQGFAEFIFCFW